MQISKTTYQEALLLLVGEGSSRSKELVREFLDTTERSAGRKEIVTEDDAMIDVYKHLIKAVIKENINQDQIEEDPGASKILLLKLESIEALKDFPVERDLLRDVFSSGTKISESQINDFMKKLRNVILHAQIDESARKIFSANHRMDGIDDPDVQEIELLKLKDILSNSLKSIEEKQATAEHKASESYVSFSDLSSIKRSIETYVERSVVGVIKSGLQGLNRALGSRGGIGRGEAVVFPASSHNYKSGILIDWICWCATYNEFVVKPGKKPLLYFVSVENEVHQNVMIIFEKLYSRTERKKIDIKNVSLEYAAEWIHKYFAQYNIEVIIDRYTPHEFSFGLFLKRYNSFLEFGYEMVMFDLDYMSEVKGIDPGDTISTQGQIQLIKENYLKFTNHAKSSGYTLVTGHQLTKAAEELASRYKNGVVKRFNYSLMADSSDVHRIVDVIIFLQLEINLDGHKFLTMYLKKNRGCMDTQESHKYCAYPFTELGILDDINDFPMYVTDINDWNSPDAVREQNASDATLF